MIISHAHKLIFLKPQKVAGTSFEIALSRHLGPRDIITPVAPEDEAVRRKAGYRGAQHHEFTPGDLLRQRKYREIAKAMIRLRMPRKYFHHIPASAVKRRVGAAVWDDYLKVSIVRNPWDIVALEEQRPALAGLADTLAGIKAKGASRRAGSRDLPAIYADHPKVAALVDVFFDFEITRFGYRLDTG